MRINFKKHKENYTDLSFYEMVTLDFMHSKDFYNKEEGLFDTPFVNADMSWRALIAYKQACYLKKELLTRSFFGLSSDSNGNEDHPSVSLPPADLIDVIGPAPDNSNKMVMNNHVDDIVGTDVDDYGDLISNEVIPDTYSSLQRGPRSRGHR